MNRAFSLVELSIVLVILGLLTGGILAGQSLIRAAELRAVTTEYNRYVTAAQTFRDKYFALPGDMAGATKFWGRASTGSDCVTNSSASAGTPGTCDGNGNAQIQLPAAASQSGENMQLWKQLALAGLIEGNYSGVVGAAGVEDYTPGTNCPVTRIATSACWTIYTVGVNAGVAGSWFAADYGTRAVISASGGGAYTGLKPEEAWNIDTKLDDGRPATGRILSANYSACTDAGSSAGSVTNYAANYALTTSTAVCGLYFARMF